MLARGFPRSGPSSRGSVTSVWQPRGTARRDGRGSTDPSSGPPRGPGSGDLRGGLLLVTGSVAGGLRVVVALFRGGLGGRLGLRLALRRGGGLFGFRRVRGHLGLGLRGFL